MRLPVVEVYGHSDVGLNRYNNEDIWMALPDLRFFALADGMGGHNAGEVAAKEAIDTLQTSVEQFLNPNLNAFLTVGGIISQLRIAIEAANKKVLTLGKEVLSYKGMGTTLCCFYFYDDLIVYAHVGDSRIYLFRNSKLKQLTHDHSLTNQLLSQGYLETSSSAYRNIITKAIGTSSKIEPTIASLPVQINDLFFTCSDGLSDFVPEEEMALILLNSLTLQGGVERLIEAAKKNGSNDNITVGMVSIKSFYDLSRQ